MTHPRFSRILIPAAAASLLLSACSAPAAQRPYERPRAEAPKAEAPRGIPAAAPTEAPKYEVPRDATKPFEQPYAAERANIAPAPALPVAPAAPAGQGPKPIAGDTSRVPIEPTSVAEPIRPEDATFKDYGVNPPIDPLRDRMSTFALDVDTASYSVARKYINDGMLPPYEAVRAEEFVNYFVQDYAPPTNGTFAVYADGAPSPFHRDGSMLMRVGVQGYQVPDAQRKPAALTFVIDVSGSMSRDNRLGLVKRSLELLVDRLTYQDSVSIVVYGSSARVVLQPTNGARRDEILAAIYSLQSEGSTNTAAGLQLGYDMAYQAHLPAGINRVILCSDGVANVGNVDALSMITTARGRAPEDVMLTTIGFGMGNYNDVMMEQLANKGNGFYAYIDTIDEARTLFLDRLTNTLQSIAKDAKAQVEFNPDVVASYRLIGYENRAVADQDFRNDSVDAGELNSGHNATALYQVQLRPGARGRIATVFLRWQEIDMHGVRELAGEINTWDLVNSFDAASPRYQMNAVVAEYAEILRRSPYSELTLAQLAPWAQRVAAQLPQDRDVQELSSLIARASELR